MIIGIDTHNIRSGGGENYIVKVLNNFNYENSKIKKIHVWGNIKILSKITNNKIIIKHNEKLLNSNNPNNLISYCKRIFWHLFILKRLSNIHQCNLIFFPGSYNFSGVKKYLCINLNILPFEDKLHIKIGYNLRLIKFLILRNLYLFTYSRASGLIFLSNYAKNQVGKFYKFKNSYNSIIPLGVDLFDFSLNKKISKKEYTQLLYVSPLDYYKNQIEVLFAIKKLNTKYNIKINFIGKGNNKYAKKFINLKKSIDPKNKFSVIKSYINDKQLRKIYSETDIKIFASECEAMPTIVLEAMASKLPIASSNIQPMTYMLKDSAVFFNPKDINSIYTNLERLILDNDFREKLSSKSFNLSKKYKWFLISKQTFEFISKINT